VIPGSSVASDSNRFGHHAALCSCT
jgi:hypothetical protein